LQLFTAGLARGLANADINPGEFLETLAMKTGPKPPKLQFPFISVLLAAHIDEAVSKRVEPGYPGFRLLA
jgi:hypothetical protein